MYYIIHISKLKIFYLERVFELYKIYIALNMVIIKEDAAYIKIHINCRKS